MLPIQEVDKDKEISRLRKEVGRKGYALLVYGRHLDKCERTGLTTCSCGLIQANSLPPEPPHDS